MAGVHRADVPDVQLVQGHEQLGPQGTVVHVAGPQEEGPQELQHHVVQLHVLAHHLRQLLHHLWGAPRGSVTNSPCPDTRQSPLSQDASSAARGGSSGV